jgi:hypothetical protein
MFEWTATSQLAPSSGVQLRCSVTGTRRKAGWPARGRILAARGPPGPAVAGRGRLWFCSGGMSRIPFPLGSEPMLAQPGSAGRLAGP